MKERMKKGGYCMDKLIEIFGKTPTKELIHGLHIKPNYDDSSVIGATFYIETENTIQPSYEIDLEDFKSINPNLADQEELIEAIKEELVYIKDNSNQLDDLNISSPMTNIIVQLGTQLYGNAATKEKVKNFENDFWFIRLRDLLQKDQAKTRKQFMRLATYWYVLIEIEGYTENQVVEVLANDKAKMHDIVEKWNVKHLSDFIERVHYIASTKQIEHFINIIKRSSANEDIQQELIEDLLSSDILDTWES
jgi:hypothetical protein